MWSWFKYKSIVIIGTPNLNSRKYASKRSKPRVLEGDALVATMEVLEPQNQITTGPLAKM